MTARRYTRIQPGVYATEIVLRSGATRRILVRRTSEANPSARGGAYRASWVACSGSLNLKTTADTREAAVTAALDILRERNSLPEGS